MDVVPVTNEIDSDEEDVEAEEAIVGRKQSSFWVEPTLESGAKCGMFGCNNFAINQCVFSYACKRGC